jgi:hypothetical protein
VERELLEMISGSNDKEKAVEIAIQVIRDFLEQLSQGRTTTKTL